MMLTAYEDEEKWDKATSGFVVNYIKKPYKDEDVLNTIKRYFKGLEEQGEMVLETFEKHIDKMEEWEKTKKSQ
jgi:response regulator RpfG family c-di-GMP phosphodiesterase